MKWSYSTGGAIRNTPAIGADGTLYFGNENGILYALTDAGTSATLKWQSSTLGSTGSELLSSPAIGPDGSVYIGTLSDGANYLYAFNGTLDFTANQMSGAAPLSVLFTGSSGVTPVSWNWNFGDGSTGTGQNPTHTYTSSGSYTVHLNMTDTTSTTYSAVKTAYIAVYSPPVPGFTSSAATGTRPLTVKFTDTSTNSPTSWSWNFGDGNTSSSQNPSHIYNSVGTYTVTLTATNLAGSNTTTQTGYISVGDTSPFIAFTASPRQGLAPLTVQFNDTSLYGPTTWSWNFGDGGTSSSQNPSHIYNSVGTYTVTLAATNAIGTNTSSQTGYITILSQAPISAGTNLYVSNDAGVKYDINGSSMTYIPNTYGLPMPGGMNSLHMSNVPSDTSGKVIQTTSQSGTFYYTFSGGQPTQQEGILMLAVNGTIPDDFSVNIRSSGDTWTLDTITNYQDYFSNSVAPSSYNYVQGALNETFTKSDFLYGPQSSKPNSIANYPIYNGENQSDPANQFQVMFIDLNSGIYTDRIKIEYSFNNLTSFAAFNVYGWYKRSNHGTGTSPPTMSPAAGIWLPAFSGSTSWFSPAIPDLPGTTWFPIAVTDTSANVPQSWSWDFGDGNTSTLQNPTHAYAVGGRTSYGDTRRQRSLKGPPRRPRWLPMTARLRLRGWLERYLGTLLPAFGPVHRYDNKFPD